MDDTNLAPWIRVINEGNLVVFDFDGPVNMVIHFSIIW